MIIAALAILVLLAAAAWFMAAISAITVMQLAPRGEKLSCLTCLGWLRSPALSTRLGPAAPLHLAPYRNAIFGFLACVIAMAAMSALIAAERSN
ncbi:MAG: hypothetical protein JNM20_05410 [Rhizobiales bacterium]|nr:hypothetical protein [Hyphomicrobiales bacterium]